MPVIINDEQESTDGDITVSIPDGQHDYMLVCFSFVYVQWWYESDNEIHRTTPSGGGGTWTALDNEILYDVYEYGRNRIRVYSWYSYPTSRGDVTLNTGGYYTDGSGDEGRYTMVFSLANAVLSENDSVSQVNESEIFDANFFNKQGGKCFCGCIGGPTLGPYVGFDGTPSVLSEVGLLISEVNSYYAQTAYNKHWGLYSSGADKRWVYAGVRYETPTWEDTAGVFVSVDSVECNL